MPTRQIKENSCACYGSSDIHDCYCNLNNKNMKTQTAIEWLVNELKTSKHYQRVINEVNQSSTEIKDVIEQAKAMEKEQIIDAVDGFPLDKRHLGGEQYYNETYKQD